MLERLSQLDKGSLISDIYQDKRERRDTYANLGMYIALPSPQVDTQAIVAGVLRQMESDPIKSFKWAEDFGRVIVAVHPKKLFDVQLASMDDKTKSYVTIESTKLFDPSELIPASLPTPNIIYLNDQLVTIEGFVVEAVHMIEEVVWTKYLSQKQPDVVDIDLFSSCINQVLQEGMTFMVTSEEELIKMHTRFGENFPLRVYGSKAIESVPEIMGGVFVSRFSPIDTFNPVLVEAQMSREKSSLDGKLDFGIGITMAKNLHAGHLALLATADIGRLSTNGRKVRIFNNDTGPRVAGMLSTLAKEAGISVDDCASMLRSGAFSEDAIIIAYRNRDASPSNEAILQTEQGGLLRAMELSTRQLLVEAGFDGVEIATESKYVAELGDMITHSLDPVWSDIGFSAARTGRGVKILGKQGNLTGTTKMISFFQDCLNVGADGIVMVDSEIDSLDSIFVAQSLGLNVAHSSGCGMGIGGKVGSGTDGELPEITELKNNFGENLSAITRYLVLTRPLLSNNIPSPTAAAFYDYQNTDALVNDFYLAQQQLLDLRQRIDLGLYNLNKERLQENTIDLAESFNRLKCLTNDQLITEFGKTKLILENNALTGQMQKLSSQFKNTTMMRNMVFSALLKGAQTNSDLISYLKAQGVLPDMWVLPQKIVGIRSNYLEAAVVQGYQGQQAIQRASDLLDKKFFISKRKNVFFESLIQTLEIMETTALTPIDRQYAIDIINLCRSRLKI